MCHGWSRKVHVFIHDMRMFCAALKTPNRIKVALFHHYQYHGKNTKSHTHDSNLEKDQKHYPEWSLFPIL